MGAHAKRFEAAGRPGIAYDDVGDPSSPPVVLLHGLSDCRTTWFDVVPRLAGSYRVLAVDQRGHGHSDKTPAEYRLEHYAADVAAFVEQVAGGPVALVGHSLGGLVSAHVAATRRELVSRAFLEDPPLYLGDREAYDSTNFAVFFPLMQQMLRDLRDRGATVEEFVTTLAAMPSVGGEGTVADMLGEAGTRRLAGAWHAFDPEGLTAAIDGSVWADLDPARPMSCPVCLLRADRAAAGFDAAFLPEHEKPFLATHPDAKVELVAGASHQIHTEQPDRFAKALEAFLADG